MKFLTSLLVLASGTAATPLRASRTAKLPAKTIFQFNETGTWLENLAVRPNGDLLLTMLSPSASIWTLKRPYSSAPSPALLHTFDNATGVGGIAETTPDTYVVVAAAFSGPGQPIAGTAAAYSVSFQPQTHNPNHGPASPSPSVHKIADIPEAQLLNGVASVGSTTVLIADSYAGVLYRLDTANGHYAVILRVPELSAPTGATLPFGVNGLKVHANHVYWSNSGTTTLYRVAIDAYGYPAPAPATKTVQVQTVAKLDAPFIDDIAIDVRGVLFAATNADNKVDAVRPDGTVSTVVGGAADDTVAGDTAVAFGRTPLDRGVIYVTTSGTLPGGGTEPAKVVAVNRAGFC
ncbi:hypothetical protein GGR54DRAFT_369406 [Hypoxylon sp. NC1633]|nr:hypothetical protein GGR54DRAFT_369406 [Hypoxylon sp. NC1633]